MDELEHRGEIGAFDKRTIIEISDDVIEELTVKYENIKREVGDIMGGALLETDARKLRDEGLSQGLSQGLSALVRSLKGMLSSPEEIYEVVVKNPEYEQVTLEQIKKLLQ